MAGATASNPRPPVRQAANFHKMQCIGNRVRPGTYRGGRCEQERSTGGCPCRKFQTRTYRWCNPPKIAEASTRPPPRLHAGSAPPLSAIAADGQSEGDVGLLSAVRERADTPNWDIASTKPRGPCWLRQRLILRDKDGWQGRCGRAENHSRIGTACREASATLNSVLPGWNLSIGSHYQLCNRARMGLGGRVARGSSGPSPARIADLIPTEIAASRQSLTSKIDVASSAI
jgi:hypothetical protein